MRTALIVTLGEIRKELLIIWTYKVGQLTGLATLAFVFVGIGFMMGDGALDSEEMSPFFLGYLAWMYTMSAIGDLSWGLRREMNAGTLEQMSMSPAPVGLILIGRVLTNFLISTGEVLLLGIVMSLLVGMQVPMRWEGVAVLALMLVGVFGFGFMIAGAVLVFKQIESLANLVQNALLFLNGSMLPVEAMPGWMAAVVRTLPSTQGVVVLRKVVLGGQSLASVWQDRSLVWLVVHSAVYFAAGWLVFGFCERVAKEQGSLGQY
jgi:ABC-2 type transport system permease protein